MEPGVARARLGFDTAERFLPLRRQLGVTSFGINLLVNRGLGRLVLLALGGAGEHVGRDGEAFADVGGRARRLAPGPPAAPAERAG